MRKHPPDSLLKDSFRTLLHEILKSLDRCTTRVTCVVEILLEHLTLARQLDFRSIHYNDEVSKISIWGEQWFVLASEQACDFTRNPPKGFSTGVDKVPLLFRILVPEVKSSLIHSLPIRIYLSIGKFFMIRKKHMAINGGFGFCAHSGEEPKDTLCEPLGALLCLHVVMLRVNFSPMVLN